MLNLGFTYLIYKLQSFMNELGYVTHISKNDHVLKSSLHLLLQVRNQWPATPNPVCVQHPSHVQGIDIVQFIASLISSHPTSIDTSCLFGSVLAEVAEMC